METNQDELARPPIVRYDIGDEAIGFVSENRKPIVMPFGTLLPKHHVQ